VQQELRKNRPGFPEKAQKVARLSRNSYLQNRLKKLTVERSPLAEISIKGGEVQRLVAKGFGRRRLPCLRQ
jgi:hypothetical protein